MRLSSATKAVISFAIAALFLYLAFRGTDFDVLWATILQAEPLWVFLLIPIGLTGHWLRAVRWKLLLQPFKINVSLRNLFSSVMIGYAVNNVLPRVGEVVRPVVVGKLENISRSAALGTVVIERVLDFLTFSFVVGITLFVYPSAIDPFVDDPDLWRPVFLAASAISIGIFLALVLKLEALVELVARYRHRLPGTLGPRIGSMLDSFRAGVSVAHLRKSWPAVAGWSMAIWGIYALGLYVPFFMFSSIASLHLGPGAAVVLLVISSIAWVLPAPGAMGTYHSFLTVAMVKLYGVDQTAALGFSVVTHEVGFVLVMIVGAYYYVVDHGRVGKMEITESRPQESEA